MEMRNFSHHLDQIHKTWCKWVENNWDKSQRHWCLWLMHKTTQQLGQAHKCAPERCGAGGKPYLHLTGGEKSQLAPLVRRRRRRVQRKRSVNKISLRLQSWDLDWRELLSTGAALATKLKCVLKGDFHVLCRTQSWSSTCWIYFSIHKWTGNNFSSGQVFPSGTASKFWTWLSPPLAN